MTTHDETIAFKVGLKLKVDPTMDKQVGESIEVTADDGIVTLEGTVPSVNDARTAEMVALSVAEVAAVNNQLEVQ